MLIISVTLSEFNPPAIKNLLFLAICGILFKASILDSGKTEITTLSDGEHTATFTFDNSSNYVYYTFKSEDHTGYRITIR